MKKILFLLLVLFAISCDKDECVFPDEISVPNGFKLQKIDKISESNRLIHLRMSTDKIGYVLNEVDDKNTHHLLKTIDGGATWNDIFNFGKIYPIDVFFLNENIGFIPFNHLSSDHSYYLKTLDGGITWEEIEQEQINGNFHNFQRDENGNLYTYEGVLSTSIFKSKDEGATWEKLFNHGAIDILKVTSNKIYTIFATDISVFDLDGNLLDSFSTNINKNNMVDFEIIDDTHFVATSFYTAMKTDDAGKHWTKIHSDAAKIIGFSDSNHGLMVFKKEYCGDNINELFVISNTSDGTSNWEESETFQTLNLNDLEFQTLDGNSHLMLADNQLYLIKKE